MHPTHFFFLPYIPAKLWLHSSKPLQPVRSRFKLLRLASALIDSFRRGGTVTEERLDKLLYNLHIIKGHSHSSGGALREPRHVITCADAQNCVQSLKCTCKLTSLYRSLLIWPLMPLKNPIHTGLST